MRAFVAVPLEPSAKRTIATALRPVAGANFAVSWVREDNLHLTLAFLGEIDEALVPSIEVRLAPVAAAIAPQLLALSSVGGFPGSRPRVLWLGVETGRDWFVSLARAVRAALEDGLGLSMDRRAPATHVTLARVRRPDRAVVPAITAALAGPAIASLADRMTLFSSLLGPGGPTYRVVLEWPFAG